MPTCAALDPEIKRLTMSSYSPKGGYTWHTMEPRTQIPEGSASRSGVVRAMVGAASSSCSWLSLFSLVAPTFYGERPSVTTQAGWRGRGAARDGHCPEPSAEMMTGGVHAALTGQAGTKTRPVWPAGASLMPMAPRTVTYPRSWHRRSDAGLLAW